MLCRVIHKSTSENLTIPHNFDDPTQICTSPSLVISATNNQNFDIPRSHQSIASFNHSQAHLCPNPSTSLGLSAIDLGYVDHHMNICSSSHDHGHNKMGDQATKCEDDYGFLFDFDGSNTVPSGLEDMRFVNDSSSVFI